MTPDESVRVRLKFSKSGSLRFVGNLDLQTIWERAARRADLPLSYSRGFHPQPKIQIAAPLPLGCSSRCEVVDIRLDQPVELASLRQRLEAAMPNGIGILDAGLIELNAPALQATLLAAEYEIVLLPGMDSGLLTQRVDQMREASALPRARRGKSYDLRPLIESLELEVDKSDGTARLRMRLSAREGATGRPDEVLDALAVPVEDARIERTNLIFQP